jgi:hypothetical protein
MNENLAEIREYIGQGFQPAEFYQQLFDVKYLTIKP